MQNQVGRRQRAVDPEGGDGVANLQDALPHRGRSGVGVGGQQRLGAGTILHQGQHPCPVSENPGKVRKSRGIRHGKGRRRGAVVGHRQIGAGRVVGGGIEGTHGQHMTVQVQRHRLGGIGRDGGQPAARINGVVHPNDQLAARSPTRKHLRIPRVGADSVQNGRRIVAPAKQHPTRPTDAAIDDQRAPVTATHTTARGHHDVPIPRRRHTRCGLKGSVVVPVPGDRERFTRHIRTDHEVTSIVHPRAHAGGTQPLGAVDVDDSPRIDDHLTGRSVVAVQIQNTAAVHDDLPRRAEVPAQGQRSLIHRRRPGVAVVTPQSQGTAARLDEVQNARPILQNAVVGTGRRTIHREGRWRRRAVGDETSAG